jgi:hypothetical protein
MQQTKRSKLCIKASAISCCCCAEASEQLVSVCKDGRRRQEAGMHTTVGYPQECVVPVRHWALIMVCQMICYPVIA